MTPRVMDRLTRLDAEAAPPSAGKHLVFQVEAPPGTPVSDIVAFLKARGHAIHDGDDAFVMNVGAYRMAEGEPLRDLSPAILTEEAREGRSSRPVAEDLCHLYLPVGPAEEHAMTPKLIERLNRLEAGQAGRTGQGPASRDLTQVWLRAVAIALGGYPRPRASAPLHLEDSFSDGFARALGYADRDEMEAQAEVDPEEWDKRVERADATLCQQYGADACPDPQSSGSQMTIAALNEWAEAKAQNPDWPQADDSGTLACALTAYGVPAEPVEARP